MKYFVPDEVSMWRFWRSVRVACPLFLRGALYALSVASLCLASVVWASGAFATPLFTTQLLVALAISVGVNGWTLARAARLKARLAAGAVQVDFLTPDGFKTTRRRS